jgi:hypothetical protein
LIGIRPAARADVDGIARVHVQAWWESYQRLVPPEAFERYSMDLRLAQWGATLSDLDRSTLVYESDGAVAGFISGGPIDYEDISYLWDDVSRMPRP